MLSSLLTILRDVVNAHLSASSGWGEGQPEHGQVMFPDGEKTDAVDFKLGTVSLLVVNLEQEHSLRLGDPHRVKMADGTTQQVSPPIHLNVDVMFVARFKDYEHSLRYISLILQFFQSHRVLDHENTPALSDKIDKVIIELHTLPISEQHNLWGLLRSTYQPSVVYRLRMIVLQDEAGVPAPLVSTTMLRRLK